VENADIYVEGRIWGFRRTAAAASLQIFLGMRAANPTTRMLSQLVGLGMFSKGGGVGF
jgi:hypothetical protein